MNSASTAAAAVKDASPATQLRIEGQLAETMAASPAGPATITLDVPIKRGDTAIEALTVRKPGSGELRGLSLVDIAQLDVDSLHTVLPRICFPLITKQEAQALDLADLMALGAEVAGFLLPKAKRPDFRDS